MFLYGYNHFYIHGYILLLLNLFVLKICLLCKRVTQKKGVTKREIFPLLLHFLDGQNDWGWASPNPGAGGFFLVSYVETGVQVFEPSYTVFPRPLAGTELEVEWPEHKLAFVWFTSVVGSGFTCCTQDFGPNSTLFNGIHSCWCVKLFVHFLLCIIPLY